MPGIIISSMIAEKNKFLPGKEKRAKANPASEVVSRPTVTEMAAT